MIQIKVIQAGTSGDLMKETNEWLEEKDAEINKIIHQTQTISQSGIIVLVLTYVTK